MKVTGFSLKVNRNLFDLNECLCYVSFDVSFIFLFIISVAHDGVLDGVSYDMLDGELEKFEGVLDVTLDGKFDVVATVIFLAFCF